tara:strand:- start:1282 stop:1806 length:525 start_codon:yes stop_codon:yes gene_type:complete
VKLDAELIPVGTWGANLRSLMPPSGWNRLRKHIYEEANNLCELCSKTGFDQNRNYAVEAHEVWEYDDVRKIQTLKGLQALCPMCHCVKHYGRSLRVGAGRKIREHVAEVNGWTREQVLDYEDLIFHIHVLRSQFRWTVEIQETLSQYLEQGVIKQRDYDEAIKNLKRGPHSEEN